MSTLTEPGITIEELPDTEISIPCEVYPTAVLEVQCGKPAMYRLRVEYPCCGSVNSVFVCHPCLVGIALLGVVCKVHRTSVTIQGVL